MTKIYRPQERRGIKNLILGITEDRKVTSVWASQIPEIRRVINVGDVTGKAGETNIIYPSAGTVQRLILCGLGKSHEIDLEQVRRSAGLAMQRAARLKTGEAVLDVASFCAKRLDPAEAAKELVIAGRLATYRFDELKREKDEAHPRQQLAIALCADKTPALERAVREGDEIAASVNYARTLANRPGNIVYPETLAQEALRLARTSRRLRVKVLRQAELRRQGFGALLAVGAGSIRPPVLIEIRYTGAGARRAPVVVVGKGITFDSGGISIKPSAKMEEMRFDMSGAATVLGIMKTADALKLPVNLIGVIPAAENMPSGSATRPGDVVKSLSGKTIEVINTDAEGRLVLADALTYSLKYKPSCILDFATLTGAVVVALGNVATGLLTNCEPLAREIIEAGQHSGEKTWQLPLWDEYRDLMKSEVADIGNISSKSGAGTIQGAVFLEKFVDNTPWVHLDIAGTAYGDKSPLAPKGATGVGIRLVAEWIIKHKSRFIRYPA